VFDNQTITTDLGKAGIAHFTKVSVDAANVKLVAQYKAVPNTLIICGSDGSVLARFSGKECSQSHITRTLKDFIKRRGK
jgi:hypothetical protein